MAADVEHFQGNFLRLGPAAHVRSCSATPLDVPPSLGPVIDNAMDGSSGIDQHSNVTIVHPGLVRRPKHNTQVRGQ